MPPSPNTPTQATLAVVVERLDNLSRKVDALAIQLGLDATDTQDFRVGYVKGHEEALNLAKSAHARLNEHDDCLKEIKITLERVDKALIPLNVTNAIQKAIGVILMGAIIWLIIDIVTHKVTLGF